MAVGLARSRPSLVIRVKRHLRRGSLLDAWRNKHRLSLLGFPSGPFKQKSAHTKKKSANARTHTDIQH